MQIFFPVTYSFGTAPSDGCGGPPVTDPGTIYLWREDGEENDWPDAAVDEVAGKTSLTSVIEDAIDGCVGTDGKIAQDHIESFKRLRQAFLNAVKQIDEAMPPP